MVIKPLPADDIPFIRDVLMNKLYNMFPENTFVLARIDTALHDVRGKLLEKPLGKLLGLAHSLTAPTADTIGILSMKEVLEKVVKLKEWPIPKFKMSSPDRLFIHETRQIYKSKI